jgi:hypothetical protein
MERWSWLQTGETQNIRRHRTKFSRSGDLVSPVITSLAYRMQCPSKSYSEASGKPNSVSSLLKTELACSFETFESIYRNTTYYKPDDSVWISILVGT